MSARKLGRFAALAMALAVLLGGVGLSGHATASRANADAAVSSITEWG